MKNLSLTEARNQLLRLAEEIEQRPDTVVVVRKRGKPVIALLSAEFYESLLGILKVLGDKAAWVALRKALREIKEGRAIPWKSARRRLALEG